MGNVTDILFSEWLEELKALIAETNSLCLALFKADGTLVFANSAMLLLLKGNSANNILNLSFYHSFSATH